MPPPMNVTELIIGMNLRPPAEIDAMGNPVLELLRGDRRTHEYEAWTSWLTEAVRLAHEFSEVEDDPFAYNETATVSLLTAAAAKADMLALAEYVSRKKRRDDRRSNIPGRCDLWLYDNSTSWAFEFKQKFYQGGQHKVETLSGWLDEACDDASRLSEFEATKRFGALVISCRDAVEIDRRFERNLVEFAKNVHFAWLLDPDTVHASRTYILFFEPRRPQR